MTRNIALLTAAITGILLTSFKSSAYAACADTIRSEAVGRGQVISEARARSLNFELGMIEAQQIALDREGRTVGSVLVYRAVENVQSVFRAMRPARPPVETIRDQPIRSVGGIRG
jgi:hypothetical protein